LEERRKKKKGTREGSEIEPSAEKFAIGIQIRARDIKRLITILEPLAEISANV